MQIHFLERVSPNRRCMSPSNSEFRSRRLFQLATISQRAPISTPAMASATARPRTILVTVSQNVRGSCIAHFPSEKHLGRQFHHRTDGAFDSRVHEAADGHTIKSFYGNNYDFIGDRHPQFPSHPQNVEEP